MNRIRRIRRLAGVLAGLACAWLGLAAAAPAAFAGRAPLPCAPTCAAAAPPVPTAIHTVVIGGMPGWQIALIAAGAAVLAATVAVLADRARPARRTVITTAT
jgi:hypothetical protein